MALAEIANGPKGRFAPEAVDRSISIAFSRWREEMDARSPKIANKRLALEIFFQGYPKNYGWKLRFRRSQLWSAGDVPQTA